MATITHVRPQHGPFTHFKVDGIEKTRETCVREADSGIPYQSKSVLGLTAPIRVITMNNGKKYLRTDKNFTEEDNLGVLPEF